MIGDELWQWSEHQPTLLDAMQTALVKNSTAKLVLLSTAAANLDSPLGRMRVRALAQPEVIRRGSHVDASGHGLRWLEWSCPDGTDNDDARAVKRANPTPWITVALLREQRRRVTDSRGLR